MFTLTTISQHCTRGSSSVIRQGEDFRDIQIEKEEVNLSLFATNMILHTENPIEITKKN